MKTEILDDNNYPFYVEPEAITTNFALFNVIEGGRKDMVLTLSSGSVDETIANREFAFTSKVQYECLAKGYFSYAGDKPNQNRWVNKVIPFLNNMSQTDINAIRSDVWNEVSRLFKGKPINPNGRPDERDTGVQPRSNEVNTKNSTNRRALNWLDDEDEHAEE